MVEVEVKDGNVVVRSDWDGVTVLPGQHVWISLSAQDAGALAKALEDAKPPKPAA